MINRENKKKISRLCYVIIFFILSHSIFIGNSWTYYSFAGEPVYRGLTKIFTQHYFVTCRQIKISEAKPPFFPLPTFEKRCGGPEKSIEINNVIIFPNTMMTVQQSEAFTNFNNNPKNNFTYQYSNNENFARREAEKITNIVIWTVFILSLPLIWFTRNFSIRIVNFFISLVSKGWKRL